MTTTLETANAALRNAVHARLEATPADDPKMWGYVPSTNAYSLADFGSPPESCCDGGKCQPRSEAYAEWAPNTAERQTGDGVMGEPATVAEQTLQAALEAVRDRHTKYGPPVEHFGRTAALVNAAFGTTFSAADWALVMVLDKVARLRGPTPTTDGGVDIAGYGGCYEECRSRA